MIPGRNMKKICTNYATVLLVLMIAPQIFSQDPTPTPSPINQSPVVNAGADQTDATRATTLNGSAIDDGLPNPPGALTYTWTKTSGPGTVTFGSPGAPSTTVTFAAGGLYTLQLAASDGALTGSDTVVCTVNKYPIVNAGLDQTIVLPSGATLSGSATDDGIPNPPGTLTYTWTRSSGPGTVTFADSHAASTTVLFSVPGSYTLKLAASDTVFTSNDTVVVNVNPPPPTPTPTPPPPDPNSSVRGAWSSLIDLPIVAIHMSVLPNGWVLMWQDDNPNGPRGSKPYTVAYIWDPTSNSLTSVDNTTDDVFCSGHAFLPNGQLLIAGGHYASDNNGTRTTYLFDSSSNKWTLSNLLMANGRWYPTVTTLANGEMLVVSGSMTSSSGVNLIPEIWQTNSGGGWRELGSASYALPLYPWMHLAPNGQVFISGPSSDTRYLDTSGTGAWRFVAKHVYTGGRKSGSSVMYDDGKVLVMGGGLPTNTAEIIDLNASSPVWQSVTSMAYARSQMNATLLPDGKVLVTGGSSSTAYNDATLAVLPAEMWDPATKSFSTMASMHVPRMYHSTAVLLPDARVLSAGGGHPPAKGTTDQRNAEIYSPPYLFQTDGSPALRPVITSVSATSLTYGQQFSLSTPNFASIGDVTWVRLSSTTHSFNANQRINHLGFSKTATGLDVTVPSSATLCPPGHYMLFILQGGVPSLAQIVQVQ